MTGGERNEVKNGADVIGSVCVVCGAETMSGVRHSTIRHFHFSGPSLPPCSRVMLFSLAKAEDEMDAP